MNITTQQGKKFTYDLTMEYIRQNKMLTCTDEQIPNQIEEIIKISNIIGESIENNYQKFIMF